MWIAKPVQSGGDNKVQGPSTRSRMWLSADPQSRQKDVLGKRSIIIWAGASEYDTLGPAPILIASKYPLRIGLPNIPFGTVK
jgi:hypothetical protein